MPSNYRLSAALGTAIRRLYCGGPVRPLDPAVARPPWVNVQSASTQIAIFNTVLLAFGSNVTSGNLLVVAIGLSNSITVVTVTDSLSNTYHKAVNQIYSAIDVEIWYAISSSNGANTVSVAVSGFANAAISVAEYSNPAGIAASPVDNTQGAFNQSNSASIPPLTVSSGSSELAVAAFTQSVALANFQATGGYNIRQQQTGGNTGVALYYLDQYSVYGTTTAAGTFNASGSASPIYWAGAGVTFKHQ